VRFVLLNISPLVGPVVRFVLLNISPLVGPFGEICSAKYFTFGEICFVKYFTFGGFIGENCSAS
jgi:hypothetical protein